MRLRELAQQLHDEAWRKGFWRDRPDKIERLLRLLVSAIVERTAKGSEVTLHDLGTFRTVEVKEKRVVTQGVTRVVPARRVLKFVAARSLRGLGRGT